LGDDGGGCFERGTAGSGCRAVVAERTDEAGGVEARMIAILWPLLFVFLPFTMLVIADAFYSATQEIVKE
jgi:hypothetical protein